jgi:intergrase/recombinase
VVLLNALVPSSDQPALIATKPLSVDEARRLVKAAKRIESFVGHASTAELLTRMLGIKVACTRNMYVPREGDIGLVVRLKKRLAKPEDAKNITEHDLEFLLVEYVRIGYG